MFKGWRESKPNNRKEEQEYFGIERLIGENNFYNGESIEPTR